MFLENNLPVVVHFLRGDAGASFSECALVASLVAVVCVVVLLAVRKVI